MECVNCDKPAVWLFKASGVAERGYCNVHLPAAYRGTKNVRPYEAHVEEVLAEAAASPTVKRTRTRKKVEAAE